MAICCSYIQQLNFKTHGGRIHIYSWTRHGSFRAKVFSVHLIINHSKTCICNYKLP